METVDEVLEHFGVKGMRWGVHRFGRNDSGGTSKPKKKPGPSVDFARAEKVRNKAKRGGLSSLSNADLKALNERMRLEQQYSELSGKNINPIAKKFTSEGGSFAKNVLLGTGQDLAKKVLTQKAAALLVKQGLLAAKGGG